MGSGKGGGQTVGYRYYMSLLMGVSRGPVDEVVQIDVGNVRAWPVPDGDPESVSGLMTVAEGPAGTGVEQYENGTSASVLGSAINTIRATGDYAIAAENLFGGDKKEGGVAGTLRVMMGSVSQTVPSYIKTLLGGRVSDFRGVATMFFDGLVTSLNPYPKKWEVRVRRVLSGWDGAVWQSALAVIWMRGGTIKAMNGAHILYEAFTNREWGRGLSRTLIDDATWTASAQTLHNEGFGLCLRYNRQSELSAFIQTVLDHIGGSIYPDRSTGNLALTLLRNDYDPNTIPLFTYNTGLIALNDAETASQDDLVNEVVVKWTDPIAKTERSARVQNIALNQSMGASNSTTTSYAGVPDVDLALRLAQRDLEVNSNALKRFEVVLDRRAWRISPGQVFRISVPERGIYNAILRAGQVSEGGGSDGRITVKAALDVFGLPSVSYIAAQASAWVPPSRDAMVADKRIVREANYAELVRAIDPANLSILSDTATFIGTIVGKPSTLSQGYDIELTPTGASSPFVGSGSFSPYVVSTSAIPATAAPVVVPFGATSDLGLVAVGSSVQFGAEIGRLEAINTGASTVTIARGCCDTVPQAHLSGTTIFFVANEVGGDGREYASGETVDVQVLPFTSTAKLTAALAPTDTLVLVGRQARPYPPGNVRVNGSSYIGIGLQTGDLALSWTHRDRITQQDQLVAHDAASVGPEAGTTYTVRVYSGLTLLRTVSGISGTGFTYTAVMRTADNILTTATFEIEAVRASLSSFNKYRFAVDYDQSGYGASGYGSAYGN